MEIAPEAVAVPLIVWAITGVVGYLVGRVGNAAKQEREAEQRQMSALCAGVRSLLRNELVKTHRDAARNEGCTLLDKEIAERNYAAYHDLGGNGTGTAMFEEIMDAPIIDV